MTVSTARSTPAQKPRCSATSTRVISESAAFAALAREQASAGTAAAPYARLQQPAGDADPRHREAGRRRERGDEGDVAGHSALVRDERCRAATNAPTIEAATIARRIRRRCSARRRSSLRFAASMTTRRAVVAMLRRISSPIERVGVADAIASTASMARPASRVVSSMSSVLLIVHGDSCRVGVWTSSGEDESIPLPADCFDSCGQVRVGLDLRAQLRDVNLARPAAADMRAVPERLHDRGPADDATWLICEQNEEPELGGRQPHVLARDEDASAVEIDADVSEHAHVRTRADGGIDDLSRDPLDREQLAGLREYRRVALLDPDDRAVLPDPADDDGYAAGSTREQVVHDRAIIAVDELQRGRRVCVQLVRREPRHPHDRAADELVARGLQAVAKDDIRRSFDKAEQVVLSEALTGASAS